MSLYSSAQYNACSVQSTGTRKGELGSTQRVPRQVGVLLTMQDRFRSYIYVLFAHSLSRCIKFIYGGDMPLYGCETWSQTFKEEHRLRVV